MAVSSKLQMLAPGAAHYSAQVEYYVNFTLQHQLMNAATWREFTEVFRRAEDTGNNGWRCEFWGKMMRGACLVYAYNGDPALYAVLEETVRELLSLAREDGAITTYAEGSQFHGWDLWGRKYVLTGLLHFYEICKDEPLRAALLTAACRHADAVLAHVGEGEGKVGITETSDFWLGVNSCTILEPMLALYRLTKEERYLDFARYILETGGISGEDSLIELALAGERMPYEYPEVKAYETMSFFEGVLAYYEITGEERYFRAAEFFVRSLLATDVTVIGCCGCTNELFDHSRLRQIHPSEDVMQETCVTVTLIRLLSRLYLLTGRADYASIVERATYNALYGAVNTEMEKQYRSNSVFDWIAPLPFDSYSPLYNARRGTEIGGYMKLRSGFFYGCCACIASAGIAMLPLTALTRDTEGFTVAHYLSGQIRANTANGEELLLEAETDYPRALDYRLTLHTKTPCDLTLRFRIPDGIKGFGLSVKGEEQTLTVEDGYAILRGRFADGTVIRLSGALSLYSEEIEGRRAYLYGPLVLARDAAKEGTGTDLTEPIKLAHGEGDDILAYAESPAEGEQLRFRLPRADDAPDLLLTDYASCGKHFHSKRAPVSVWLNIR